MTTFLDQQHSLEEILPEGDLDVLPEQFSRAFGVTLAAFGKEGQFLGAWSGGQRTHDEDLAMRLQKGAKELWRKLLDSVDPLEAPQITAGAWLAPVLLDLDLAGAVAVVPKSGTDPGIARSALELVWTSLSSLLYAHYRAMLASEMQVASVEQSYADLENQNHQLAQALERVKALDRLKSDFVANVNHELRTPLTAILGFAELLELERDNFTPDQVECISQIHEKAAHLVKLIGRVLAFTETDGARPSLHYSNFSLPELVREIFAEHASIAERQHVDLVLEEGCSPFPELEADAEKIEAVVDNLVENAIKFSPRGGKVRLVLEISEDAGPTENAFLDMAKGGQREVLIHIIDQGEGFSPEQMEEIFTDFHQLDSSSTREFGGMGLGLALARRAVEIHGGRIFADSAPGEGAHFVVSLPLHPAPERRTSPKRRVLVVEDEAFIVRLIGAVLQERGYEVLAAGTTKEAQALIHGHPLDLMLLDVRLPDRSGLELLEDLRKDKMSRSLPVALVTAYGDPTITERAKKAGALEVLLKPFTRQEILDLVDRILPTR